MRLNKPWSELNETQVSAVGGQTGVYELGNNAGEVVLIGCAGGRSMFGLRGELQSQLGRAAQFRVEVTTAYRTRHRELLMAHYADHDRYPALNSEEDTSGLGKLSP